MMWQIPLQLHSGRLFINSQTSIFIIFCYNASAINFKWENLPAMSVDEKISETRFPHVQRGERARARATETEMETETETETEMETETGE